MTNRSHRHIVLIGGQRCGTTWLGDLLLAQAGVRRTMVLRPEPKFFLTDDDHRRYDALFADTGGTWWLDKSTTYLERGDAAARAKSCVPDALVLAVLRDPVERAHSNWRFSVVNGIEDRTFDDSLTSSAQQRQLPTLSTSPFESLRRGRYAELLAPWVEAFGENVVVLQYERMVARAGTGYVADRLGAVGLDVIDPGGTGPVNEAPLDDAMSERARAWLADYYRESNRALVGVAPDIDLDLWEQ